LSKLIKSLEKEVNMAKCEMCGKKPMVGNSVSHSMRHTRRQWKPNIQKTTVFKDGRAHKVKLCSRCLRTAAKQ
jgi:large subunit ribosomal protein L28